MEISQVFDPFIPSRFLAAPGGATKNDIVTGVVLEIMDYQEYSLDKLFDKKNQIRVHKDFKTIVKDLWEKINLDFPQAQDETGIMENFQSRHFSKVPELVKVFGILSKRYTGRPVWKLLAVDGLMGEDVKYYVQNLKYSFHNTELVKPSEPEEVHVRAVRKLYEEFTDLTPAVLAENLNDLYNDVVNEEALLKSYRRKVGRYLTAITNAKKDKKPKRDEVETKKAKKQKMKEEGEEEPRPKKQKVGESSNEEGAKKAAEPRAKKQKEDEAAEPKAKKAEGEPKSKKEPKVKKQKVETETELENRLKKEQEEEMETANRIKKEILAEEQMKSDLHDCLFNLKEAP